MPTGFSNFWTLESCSLPSNALSMLLCMCYYGIHTACGLKKGRIPQGLDEDREGDRHQRKVNGWTNVPVRNPFPEPAEQDLPPPLAPVSAAKWVRFWAEGLIRAYYSEIKEEIYVMLRNLLFDSNDAFLHSMWFLRVHALQSKQGDAENRHCIVGSSSASGCQTLARGSKRVLYPSERHYPTNTKMIESYVPFARQNIPYRNIEFPGRAV